MANIFDALERADTVEKQVWDERHDIYLTRVEINSDALQPHLSRNQLPFANGLSDLMLENSQKSRLPEPIIKCGREETVESSRFNYGLDMSVNKRLIDVSGQLISNDKLRSMPQRSTIINAGTTTRLLPYKAPIAALSHSLATEIKDNRFNVRDVSAAARYKIQPQGFDYRKEYGFGKDQLLKDLYGLQPIA